MAGAVLGAGYENQASSGQESQPHYRQNAEYPPSLMALNVGDTVPSRGQDWFVSWELRKSYFYAQYTVRHRKQWLLRLLGGGADDAKRLRQVD